MVGYFGRNVIKQNRLWLCWVSAAARSFARIVLFGEHPHKALLRRWARLLFCGFAGVFSSRRVEPRAGVTFLLVEFIHKVWVFLVCFLNFAPSVRIGSQYVFFNVFSLLSP